MSTLIQYIDPFHKRGWYIVPHAILAALVLAVLALAGAFTVKYTASYFRHTYRAPLRAPGVGAPVHASVGALPSAASIHFAYFMTATNQQDGLGSCQSWSFSKQLSYAANWNRQANGTHLHHFFSPRYSYDTVSNGQDAGSYLEQYPPIAQTGIPRWIAFPYPPYQVDYPVPAVAPLYRLNTSEHQLFAQQGAGAGGLALIKQALSTHHAVNIDLPVFPEYDAATQHAGNVGVPFAGETDRGGHANVAVAFSDAHYNSTEGTYGAVLVSNQWGFQWGTPATSVTGSSKAGYAWLSYNFVETEVWDAAVVHVSTATMGAHVGHKPPFKSPIARRLVRPPAGVSHKIPSPKKVALSGYYVHGVYATDRPYDLSPLFNADGARWGISPVGLAATYASECGLKTGVNGDCDRIGYGADVSGGGCQVTVGTAAGYGIGNGLSTPGNIFSVFAWEDNPINCIGLEAHIMHDYSVYRGGAQYAPLNILWNCGPATTAYPFPYGQCASNYYGDFLGWWNFSLSHWATYQPPTPPKPRPIWHFPTKRYCRYDRTHHLTCPSAYWKKGRLGKVAFTWARWGHAFHGRGTVDHVCGGVVAAEQWNKKLRMERQRFSHCIAYSWPRYRSDPVKWIRKHAKRR